MTANPPPAPEVPGDPGLIRTTLVVPDVARGLTTDTFAGLPIPLSIDRRKSGGVVLTFTEPLGRSVRQAIVRRCQTPGGDVEDLAATAAGFLADCQSFLDTVGPPDEAALSAARTATAAYLATPPVLLDTPTAAQFGPVLAQIQVLSRAFLADQSTTKQTRRLTRGLMIVVRILRRRRRGT